jgi:hypothetical protein
LVDLGDSLARLQLERPVCIFQKVLAPFGFRDSKIDLVLRVLQEIGLLTLFLGDQGRRPGSLDFEVGEQQGVFQLRDVEIIGPLDRSFDDLLINGPNGAFDAPS